MVLTYDQVMEIRRLKAEGLKYEDIQDKYGYAPATISKALKMSEVELEAMKKTPTPEQLMAAGKMKGPLTPTVVRRVGEEAITTRAIDDYSELLKYGNFCMDYIKPIAKDMGYHSLIDFVTDSVEFYRFNKGKVHKLENQNYFYKILLSRLINDVRSFYDRENVKSEIRNLILTAHVGGSQLPREVYDSYIKTIGGEKNA